jgi:hypothetical protein
VNIKLPEGAEVAKAFYGVGEAAQKLGMLLQRWAATTERSLRIDPKNRSRGRGGVPMIKSVPLQMPSERIARSPFKDSSLARWQLISARLAELRAVRDNESKGNSAIDAIMGKSMRERQDETLVNKCVSVAIGVLNCAESRASFKARLGRDSWLLRERTCRT